jgi:hypothetical protein
MLVVPRLFLRAIGVEDDGRAVAWTVGVGVREQIAMLNIVANRQRRIGMWSRVAGDTMDLALLGGAYRMRPRDKGRIKRSMALAGVLFATDLVTAVRLSKADGTHVRDGSDSTGVGAPAAESGGPSRVRTAVTIRREVDEVRRAFRAFGWRALDAAALESSGDARFVQAPGQRGTELHIDHDPGDGAILSAASKITGKASDQQISDDLRRFKCFVETGVLARSETSPEGPSSTRRIFHKVRPAQPSSVEA